MGKKSKIGKNRRDKFYALAKESGYRSRASFKLIQLNQTFNFFNEAQICIDLCAAPGGWLQVASKYMPITGRIVGVDLHPIKPLKNINTFCCDITTDKCRQELRRLLNKQPADIVLHDGAPNMGTSWLLDSYNQNVLALKALKLAVDFLQPNGWFITKLFRAKDYFSFCWVAQQFFKQIHTTKPSASRTESSEIFVICQGFLNPAKFDQQFFDEKFVFKEVQPEKPLKLNVNSLFPKSTCRKPRNREGYPDDVTNLFKRVTASEFIESENYVQLLSEAYEIEIDQDWISESDSTNPEILECLKDIKVLGKREIKNLLKWRCKLRQERHDPQKHKQTASNQNASQTVDKTEDCDEGKNGHVKDNCDEKEDEDDTEIDLILAEANESERKNLKRKRRKSLQQKRKHRNRLALKMINPGDEFDIQNESVFSIKQANELKQLLTDNNVWNDLDSENARYQPIGPNEWFKKASMDVGASAIIDDFDNLIIDDVTNNFDLDKEASYGKESKIPKKGKKTSDGATKKEKHQETLTAEELALAHVMKQSSQAKQDLIDQSYHRFSGYGDTEGLPKWFVEDEAKHCRRPPEAPKELVNEYKERMKAINARPIKKVAEARLRKQHRKLKATERLLKKVESVPDDLEPAERQQRIEEIYRTVKKSLNKKKKPVQLVVAGKGSIPKKGRYKLVDRRMKKDKRMKKGHQSRKSKGAQKKSSKAR